MEIRSLLTRGRGLKLACLCLGFRQEKSPLTQGRGLKPKRSKAHQSDEKVAPHAGAWIETCLGFRERVRIPLTTKVQTLSIDRESPAARS